MATICLICGDKGFELAMDTCSECRDYSCHRYCRRVLPEELFGDEPWLCEDCDPEFVNVCKFQSSSPTSEEVSDSSEPGKQKIKKSLSRFEMDDSDSLSTSELKKKDKSEPKLKKRRRFYLEEQEEEEEETSQLCSQSKSPTSTDIEIEELKMSDCDTGMKIQRKLVIEDNDDGPLEASRVERSNSLQNLVPKKFDCNEPQSYLENKPEKRGCEVSNARGRCDNDDNLQKLGTCYSNSVPQSEKNSNKDQKLEEQQMMITSEVSAGRAELSNVSEKKYQKPKKRKLILDEDDDDDDDRPLGTKAKTKFQLGNDEKEVNKTSEPIKPNPVESRDKDQNGPVLKRLNISRHRVASSPGGKITRSLKSSGVCDQQRNASNLPREKTICGFFEPWRREQRYKDQKFGHLNRPLGTYGNNQRPVNRHHRRLHGEADNDLKHSGFICRNPVLRGLLIICDRESSSADRFPIVAHLSTSANDKACDVARKLPNCVFLDKFSRSQLWPRSFYEAGPSCHHIALCFFSAKRSYKFERFIDHMFEKDLALIAVFENVELVVFTSHILPRKFQTIESKYFLWGGFRTRMVSSLTNRLRCQQLCNGGDSQKVLA